VSTTATLATTSTLVRPVQTLLYSVFYVTSWALSDKHRWVVGSDWTCSAFDQHRRRMSRCHAHTPTQPHGTHCLKTCTPRQTKRSSQNSWSLTTLFYRSF